MAADIGMGYFERPDNAGGYGWAARGIEAKGKNWHEHYA
jgi:hypothetical protein